MQYDIKRGSTTIVTVKPTGKQEKKIMDVNTVSMTFTLPTLIALNIGDQCTVYGEVYTIKELPDIKEVSSLQFDYTVTFKGKAYDLIDVAFLGPDSMGNLNQVGFSVMGTASVIIDLLLLNANRFFTGWTKGTIDTTPAQNFTFSENDTCLSVLSTIATAYSLEWWVDGQTIHMTKKGIVETVTYQYGKGKGLYDVTRTTQTDKNVCTRLYVYGSSDNIPADYRNYSKKLKLAAPLESNIYVNNDPAQGVKYGIIEKVQVFDDIKPEFKGTVKTVIDKYNFTDIAIDFNVEDQQLVGIKPQVTFLTGQLAGYSFEVGGFIDGTKQVRILKNTDEKALDLPNDTLKPAPGDVYSFIKLKMPDAYITDAETRLTAAGLKYLDDNDEPWVVYSVTCDPINFAARNLTLTLGNYVKMIDTAFGLNQNIRITAFTRDLQNGFVYTMDLQEVVSIAQIIKNYNVYNGIKTAVSINNLKDINRARMNYKTTQELKSLIYDPDGQYFDPGNIKPASIETLMLSVGAKAQQFLLGGVLIKPNYEGDAENLMYSAGQLTHFALFDTPHTWNIAASSLITFPDPQAYYIYAKCSKTTADATLIFNDTPIATEAIAGYYCFWIGVLSSVIDGVRGISLTYGQTTINGRFVTTGRIQSNDGETYFDLDDGVISGKITFASGSSGYDNITDKPDLSVYSTTDFVNAIKDDLQSQIDGEITTWFYDYAPTLSNAPASDWTDTDTKNKHLGDLFYYKNTGYAYRFQYDTGTSTYGWYRISDTDITLALSNAAAAQDTADHKRRVFLTTPTTPYDAGDLWAGGASADIKRCVTSRATGSYNSADWELASKYTDDTTAALAIANAANAQDTADRAADITDYLFTTISGNLVASGTFLIGDATYNNGGLTGVTDAGASSVRLFLGADYAHKDTAPLRLLQDGSIIATKGKIGNWDITTDGLSNESSNDASIIQVKTLSGGKTREARVGTSIKPSIDGELVAYFVNDETGGSGSINGSLYARANGATVNIAAQFDGDVIFDNGNSETGDHTSGGTNVYMVHLPVTSSMADYGNLVIHNGNGKLAIFFP